MPSSIKFDNRYSHLENVCKLGTRSRFLFLDTIRCGWYEVGNGLQHNNPSWMTRNGGPRSGNRNGMYGHLPEIHDHTMSF